MQIPNSWTNPTLRVEPSLPRLEPTTGTSETSFAGALGQALQGIEDKNAEANVAVANMLDGTGEVHTAMIALHEAEEAVEITVALRNKFVQAYQEIMRMPL